MEISEKLRERFCKDCGLPIKIFKEPYFSDRLKLFDGHFNSVYKWTIFKKELDKYKNEQLYQQLNFLRVLKILKKKI